MVSVVWRYVLIVFVGFLLKCDALSLVLMARSLFLLFLFFVVANWKVPICCLLGGGLKRKIRKRIAGCRIQSSQPVSHLARICGAKPRTHDLARDTFRCQASCLCDVKRRFNKKKIHWVPN